jgi:hypothetical protein
VHLSSFQDGRAGLHFVHYEHDEQHSVFPEPHGVSHSFSPDDEHDTAR